MPEAETLPRVEVSPAIDRGGLFDAPSSPSVVSIPTEEYLTPIEAAKLLKLSVQTIRRMIKDGELSAFKPSKRRWLIPSASLREMVAKKSV